MILRKSEHLRHRADHGDLRRRGRKGRIQVQRADEDQAQAGGQAKHLLGQTAPLPLEEGRMHNAGKLRRNFRFEILPAERFQLFTVSFHDSTSCSSK